MKKGFTLVEMAAVLAILAIVTHLAVRELGTFKDRKQAALADRQLEALRESVFAYDRDGEPSGFLADMGRLAAVTNGTLAELWQKPEGARPFAVRAATAANLAVSEGMKAELADGGVYVPTGWRGPYLRLAFGKRRLFDPWGNAIEQVDPSGLARVWVTNGVAMAVSHYGASARRQDEKTLSLIPAGGATSRLVIMPVSTSGETTGEITYRWYGPASGMITGALARAVYPQGVVFENMTPGIRVVKDSASGVARKVRLRPGDNLMEIKIP